MAAAGALHLRKELVEYPQDPHLRRIVLSYISLLLELAARYYERQFQVVQKDDFGRKIDTALDRYYAEGRQVCEGVPGVRYCAGELCLSPNYFGDLVRARTDESASRYIRRYLMEKARRMLLEGQSVSAVSDALGFEYPPAFHPHVQKGIRACPKQNRQGVGFVTWRICIVSKIHNGTFGKICGPLMFCAAARFR